VLLSKSDEVLARDSHYVLGRPHRLEVVYENNPPRVSVKGKNKIILQVRQDSSLERREEVLTGWYRNELRTIAKELLEAWQKKIGVTVESWVSRR
jgi:predicted metal-dependent hydrolase